MECQHAEYRKKTRDFLSGVEDDDLFRRRSQHEEEREDGLPDHPMGTVKRARRLIWMREVRTQIAERELES